MYLAAELNDNTEGGRASYHLSLVENSIFYFLMSNLDVKYPIDHVYEADIKELQKLLNYHTQSLPKLKYAILDFAKRDFEYPNINFTGPCFQLRLEEKGHIKYSLSPDPAQEVLNMITKEPVISRYRLGYMLNLRTYYAQRLYILFSSLTDNGRVSFEIGTGSNNDLYEICCTSPTHKNMVPQTWNDFGVFRRRVLEPVVKDLNENTDLKVNYEMIKSNTTRKIIGVDFILNYESNNVYFDDTLYSIKDMRTYYTKSAATILEYLPDISNTYLALYILASIKHAPSKMDISYLDKWVPGYFTFYADMMTKSGDISEQSEAPELERIDSNVYATPLHKQILISLINDPKDHARFITKVIDELG